MTQKINIIIEGSELENIALCLDEIQARALYLNVKAQALYVNVKAQAKIIDELTKKFYTLEKEC